MNKLNVDGQDYFFPNAVIDLKAEILAAVRAGGGYVDLSPTTSGGGPDVLFSSGTYVAWSAFEIEHVEGPEPAPSFSSFDFDEPDE